MARGGRMTYLRDPTSCIRASAENGAHQPEIRPPRAVSQRAIARRPNYCGHHIDRPNGASYNALAFLRPAGEASGGAGIRRERKAMCSWNWTRWR